MESAKDWVDEARYAVEHACYKIANAELRLYPTPHFYIPEIFPPDFYKKIVEYFPLPDALNPMQNSEHGSSMISEKRYYLSYLDGDSRHIPQDHAEFWDAFFTQLSTKRFADIAGKKFANHLDIIRRTLRGHHHEILLISDRTGYDIGPHTDTGPKQFSLLFYCPSSDQYPQIGTTFFRPKGTASRRVKRTDSWLRMGDDPSLDFNDFDMVYTAPYLPNALFGFVRTRYSYHGVEATNAPIARQLIIYESFSTKTSRQLRAKRQHS